jgi:hypothetical protein
MMFSGYPQSDFTDPVAAALSMCAVFEDYSDELIKFATDPKTGVQRKHKWPPKIAEVVEFCDERIASLLSFVSPNDAACGRDRTRERGDG